MEPARWTRRGLTLAVVGALLAVSPFHVSLYALPKLFLLSLGTLAAWASLPRQQGPRDGVWVLQGPILLFAAVHLISTACSHDPIVGLLGGYELRTYGLLPLAMCAALAWAAACHRTLADPHPLLQAVALAGGALGLYGMLQAAGMQPFGVLSWMPTGLQMKRAGSLMGNPVYLGSALLQLLPVALHLCLRPERSRDRWIGAGSGSLILAGLFLTASRGAWLGATVACGTYLLAAGTTARLTAHRRRVWAAGVLGILLGIAGIAAFHLRRDAGAAGRSDSGRMETWRASLRMVRQAPWLGVGPESFYSALGREKTDAFVRAYGPAGIQVHAHNDVLHVLATMGIAGLAAYLWLMMSILKLFTTAWRREASRPLTAISGGALLGLFLLAKFNPVPLASLALAALLLGLTPGEDVRPSGRVRAAATAFALAACGVAGWMLVTDHAYFRAMLARSRGRMVEALDASRLAARLNPLELRYELTLGGMLLNLARKSEDPSLRPALLREALAAGRRAVAWHADDAEACHMLGASLMTAALLGGGATLEEARSWLDRAATLDRTHPVLQENRKKLADLLGTQSPAAPSPLAMKAGVYQTSPR